VTISAALYTVLYNLVVSCLVLGGLSILWRLGKRRTHTLALGFAISILAFSVALILGYPGSTFGIIHLAAWVCFFHIPAYLVGSGFIFRSQSPQIAIAHLVLAGIILLIGFDAFVLEPHWLEVTRLSIHSNKISDPIRVVVVADIQTDRAGAYEERVMRTALEQNPDLLLFAGDYIQLPWNSDSYDKGVSRLNVILKGFDLELPLGTYAVAGNVDKTGTWSSVFHDLPVVVIDDTASLDLGMMVLTGLRLGDSYNTHLLVSQRDKFHIVMGHSPNFSLGDVEADLLLAGHTHGGQVQLPFAGPLFTLSSVSRDWASGLTEVSPGKTLIVSRGVGMERMDAPRMRFLCRPEILVIDLIPV
jgi:predicted MPP superfamily phosphohydrolase